MVCIKGFRHFLLDGMTILEAWPDYPRNSWSTKSDKQAFFHVDYNGKVLLVF